ncbi:MAG: metallophosphoesterase [Crocinitomicaceae bacterium]
MSRLIPFVIILLLVDIYFFRAIKTVTENQWVYRIYWGIDIVIISLTLFYFISAKYNLITNPKFINVLFGLVVLSLVPKLLAIFFLLTEDIYRLIHAAVVGIGQLFSSSEGNVEYIPGRRKIISQIALGIAAIPFVGIIYGMVKGKYDYRVHRIKLAFKDLPKAFDGFTITQLSDIHSGSFDSKKDVQRGIQIANDQKSELLLFTGDLVNNKASEMDDWISVFSKLEANMGKYSILGNHDYGDYMEWENEADKKANLEDLKNVHKEMGFRLMLNENITLEKGGESISLIGVENWGKMGFHKYGDLDKSLEGVDNAQFKILMSHDPSHWEAQVLNHEKHIHLTLSGHTHGMQMGIEIPGFKWSPIQYIYKQWAGDYSKGDKHIYVNRGFGFLGFPGRVGILPEITVIQLTRA